MKRFDDDDEEFIESRKHKKSKSKKKSREKDLDDLYNVMTLQELEKEFSHDSRNNAQ